MNVGISDIYHKCDKTNIWTEEANDRVKNSMVAGQTQFDRFQFSVKYVQRSLYSFEFNKEVHNEIV